MSRVAHLIYMLIPLPGQISSENIYEPKYIKYLA